MYDNRFQAGKMLGNSLLRYVDKDNVVMAIPRGGVPIGFEVANILKVPLDIVVVRKVGAPHQPELGIGAVSSTVDFIDQNAVLSLHVSDEYIHQECLKQKEEVVRRELEYRRGHTPLLIAGKIAIIVDDGLATGVSAKTAVLTVKKLLPQKIIFATPVCARQEREPLFRLGAEIVCLLQPEKFRSVGQWYRDFSQTTDQQVIDLLERNHHNYIDEH